MLQGALWVCDLGVVDFEVGEQGQCVGWSVLHVDPDDRRGVRLGGVGGQRRGCRPARTASRTRDSSA